MMIYSVWWRMKQSNHRILLIFVYYLFFIFGFIFINHDMAEEPKINSLKFHSRSLQDA